MYTFTKSLVVLMKNKNSSRKRSRYDEYMEGKKFEGIGMLFLRPLTTSNHQQFLGLFWFFFSLVFFADQPRLL